jgi:hypothetical protein
MVPREGDCFASLWLVCPSSGTTSTSDWNVLVNQNAHVAELADAQDSGFHFWPFFPDSFHHLKQRQYH